MNYFFVVLITLFVFWTIGLIITFINEDYSVYWSAGLMLWIALWALRLITRTRKYIIRRSYYKKNGLGYIPFLFGKNVVNR